MKRSMFSATWSGWSEVRARIRSGGSRCAAPPWWNPRPARTRRSSRPAASGATSVIARLRCQWPARVRPGVEVEEARRALVAPVDVHQVAKVERRSAAATADDDAADLLLVPEFTGRIERHRPAARLPPCRRSARCCAPRRMSRSLPVGDAVRGHPLLGEAQRHLLLQHAGTVHLADLVHGLEGPPHQVGEVVQLAIAVLVPRHRGEPLPASLAGSRITAAVPGVGMELGDPEPILHETADMRRRSPRRSGRSLRRRRRTGGPSISRASRNTPRLAASSR